MYGRNNITTRPIQLGLITDTSTGTVQTTGASSKIRKDGGSWVAGSGSLSVEEGIWSYTPSQSETDAESLEVIAYKNGCYSAFAEVVTTKSSSFGYASIDFANALNQNSPLNLANTYVNSVGGISGISFPSNFNNLTISGVATEVLFRVLNPSDPSGSLSYYVQNSDVKTSTRLSSLGANAPSGWIDAISLTQSVYDTISMQISIDVGSGNNLPNKSLVQTLIGITV